uniref:Putative effector protein n=1 Tax=Heterodera avenae TaxID=34510 RepID=A0A2L0VDJ8_HETAV|nr:putative effector protein [Heterodera avenae]
MFNLLLFLLCFAPLLAIERPWVRRDPVSLAKFSWHLALKGTPKYKWEELWYHNMPIDHFSFGDTRTFQMRYLLNTDHFHNKNAPIFFYTGNEGSIEGFAENTGFMWDIAPEFGAAVVFAEHRFYGKTQPFGNESYTKLENLGYLSSEQALADFAQLIDYLKNEKLANAKHSPVIGFGGSYGGMLTAWMRIKYPHLMDGGIASSAPVFWFVNVPTPPEDSYDKIVSRTFVNSGCSVEGIKQSMDAIRELAKTTNGRRFLNEKFRLSPKSLVESPSDGDLLANSVKDVIETLAMVDYPYPASFLAALPGWPVQEACKAYSTRLTSEHSLAMAAHAMLNLFYNYTGQQKDLCLFGKDCPGTFSELGDPDGWPWQACTEMVMPMCSQGPPRDPFSASCPYHVQDGFKWCQEHFAKLGFRAELFRPQWAMINYGTHYPTASNIVFSNGWLDPWSGGGWMLKPGQQGTLVSLIVEDGAHHYDLRGENPVDTASVREVRQIEKLNIKRWIVEAHERHSQQKRILRERILDAQFTN